MPVATRGQGALINCRPPDYITPDGFEDEAFTYVYDTSLLTNGADYRDLVIPIDPCEDFLLRKVEMGSPLAYLLGQGATSGKFWIKDQSGRRISSSALAPGNINGFETSWSKAIVPEIPYAGGSQLRFDLYGIQNRVVQSAGAGGPITQAHALFQGVLRKPAGPQPKKTPFRRQGYYQPFYVTVNWPGYSATNVRLNDARRFQFPIDDYDFELCGMHVRNMSGVGAVPPPVNSGAGGASGSIFSEAALMLYDPYLRARSSDFMLAEYMNTRLTINQQAANFGNWNPSIWGYALSPPILYPAGGLITMDVKSLCFPANVPCQLQIVFLGFIRIPVRG